MPLEKLDLSNTPVSPAGLRQAVIRVQGAFNALLEETQRLSERLAALEPKAKPRGKSKGGGKS